MKLYFFKAAQGNVGDDLNVWLWPKIIPELLDEDSSHLLVGVGTLLNHRIPKAKRYTVLSSGIGYGKPPPLATGEWEFIALRGPRSLKAVGATNVPILLDGAYLSPRYFKPEIKKTYSVAYIPHVDSIICGQWEKICQKAGIKLIDPRWSVEKFITELSACECVLTEAMHGAIFADAYNIPWHPVKAYDFINEKKWNDWAESLNMTITFSRISPSWIGDTNESAQRKFIHFIKRTIKSCGFYPKNWTPPPISASSDKQLDEIAIQLTQLAKVAEFRLSDAKLKAQKVDSLMEAIENLKTKYKNLELK